jgi:hypothetical protein
MAMATSLMLLLVPIKQMGNMDTDSLKQGLIGIGVAIAAITASMKILNGGNYAGIGVGLTLMAVGLTALVIPIKLLGSMPWQALALGLGAIGLTLAAFVATSLLLAPVGPALLTVASAMALFGVSALAVGAGLTLISVGFGALAISGAAKIGLSNRSRQKAEELAGLIVEKTGAAVMVAEWPNGEAQHCDKRIIEHADLVVQTTPLGMYPRTAEAVPLPFIYLKPGAVVCDLVYNPSRTNFLNKAAQAGAVIVNGLGMLLYQGSLAFELWTGIPAPVQVMRDALLKALSTARS